MGEKYPLEFGPNIVLGVGLNYLSGASAPWRIEFDNVVLQ